MSEMGMIERVARAIDPMAAKLADILLTKGLKHKDVLTILPMDKARAAIDAMREPTEVMVKAGASIYCSEYEAPDIWKDMIDAALGQRDTSSSA